MDTGAHDFAQEFLKEVYVISIYIPSKIDTEENGFH